MFKLIILIVMCFVLSGCSVDYNLEINESKIKENFIINDNISESTTAEDILSYYNKYYPVYIDEIEGVELESKEKLDNVNYYEKNYIIDSYGYHMTYNFNHELKNYYRSTLLVYAYSSRDISINNNILTLQTKSMNNYIRHNNLEKLTVNIKTDYKVIENNADLINDNVYTWYFTKENNATKRLKMNIDLSTSKDEEELKEQENLDKQAKSKTNMIIIGIVILIYLGVMIYIVFKRKK